MPTDPAAARCCLAHPSAQRAQTSLSDARHSVAVMLRRRRRPFVLARRAHAPRTIGALLVTGALATACAGRNEATSSDTETSSANATDEPAAPTTSPPDADPVPIESTGADELRDLIRPGDPSAFVCLVDLGTGPGEFYDKVNDELVFPDETAFVEARYADGSTVEIRIHPELVATATALDQARRIAEPIGLLPTELRAGIERVGFLGGDATAQGDGGGEGIHVYAENVVVREAAGRFEETIFHESVHTSLDDQYAESEEWRTAQTADGQFLTAYAASQPEGEDLAETALYAWAVLHHPSRVSNADATAWRAMVPNRIAVIDDILSGPDAQPTASNGDDAC